MDIGGGRGIRQSRQGNIRSIDSITRRIMAGRPLQGLLGNQQQQLLTRLFTNAKIGATRKLPECNRCLLPGRKKQDFTNPGQFTGGIKDITLDASSVNFANHQIRSVRRHRGFGFGQVRGRLDSGEFRRQSILDHGQRILIAIDHEDGNLLSAGFHESHLIACDFIRIARNTGNCCGDNVTIDQFRQKSLPNLDDRDSPFQPTHLSR